MNEKNSDHKRTCFWLKLAGMAILCIGVSVVLVIALITLIKRFPWLCFPLLPILIYGAWVIYKPERMLLKLVKTKGGKMENFGSTSESKERCTVKGWEAVYRMPDEVLYRAVAVRRGRRAVLVEDAPLEVHKARQYLAMKNWKPSHIDLELIREMAYPHPSHKYLMARMLAVCGSGGGEVEIREDVPIPQAGGVQPLSFASVLQHARIIAGTSSDAGTAEMLVKDAPAIATFTCDGCPGKRVIKFVCSFLADKEGQIRPCGGGEGG